jgi:hypothetical protein
MLRKTGSFENDRAEVTVEFGPRDKFEDGIELAKNECQRALQHEGRRFYKLLELLIALPAEQAKAELQVMIDRLGRKVGL